MAPNEPRTIAGGKVMSDREAYEYLTSDQALVICEDDGPLIKFVIVPTIVLPRPVQGRG